MCLTEIKQSDSGFILNDILTEGDLYADHNASVQISRYRPGWQLFVWQQHEKLFENYPDRRALHHAKIPADM
ncbi:hypothetical protein GCM10022392_15350 [Mucilaginibacter panaciglaebae]|uniref:Uncharacterized protein n=1 Tax=Mucilaginibacter panaciglaebae TaxID=502331 RepID=A0ABP7WRH8_9SPHI